MEKIIKTGDAVIKSASEQIEKRVAPIRQSAFKRFPVLFTILGAFGVASVFYGFEVLISKSVFLTENPLVIVVIGVITLYATGKLYRKLD